MIATFRGTKGPLSPELLKKVQAFLQDEYGALATGTVSYAEHWTGSPCGGSFPATRN